MQLHADYLFCVKIINEIWSTLKCCDYVLNWEIGICHANMPMVHCMHTMIMPFYMFYSAVSDLFVFIGEFGKQVHL